MIKFFKINAFLIAALLGTSCSQVLQTVDLDIDVEDNSLQDEFNVIEKTLTIKEATKQKNSPYIRKVMQDGRGKNAQSILEEDALKSQFPANKGPIDYKIGIGDVLTFSKLIDNNQYVSNYDEKLPTQPTPSKYKLGVGDKLTLTLIKENKTINQPPPNSGDSRQNLIISSQKQDNTINSTGRIGSDGSVLLLEVGRLDASGKSLNELRSEVRNILIRNGVSPRFQLEITDFQSQRVYLTITSSQGIVSNTIKLNDQKTTLLDILTSNRISFQPGVITIVKLRRKDNIFIVKLRDVFNKGAPVIPILDRDHIFVEETTAEMVRSVSKVDQSGSVVFAGVGKVEAFGRSLDELQKEIKNFMRQVPNSQNAFQIEITEFLSQTALLSTPEQPGVTIAITDNPTTLTEVLANNGLRINAANITRINLWRGDTSYQFTLDDLLNPKTPNVYLEPGDRITANILPYKENKVFILGGVAPTIFKINPANRETLADVLFTSGGALSASSAKRSDVYLLRGNDPVVAYHLDAQSPTRLIVADAMELRPNDILYVAEQPIVSFNRTLATIIPLRILLRDIQDENIP